MARRPTNLLRIWIPWLATGAAVGAWIAIATIRMNGSIVGARDALVFQAWTTGFYALAFTAAGALAALVERAASGRRLSSSDHVAIALTTMLGHVVGSLAATESASWVTEVHLRAVGAGLGGALVALVATTWIRTRRGVERTRARLLVAVLLGLAAAPLVALTVAPRRGPAATAPANIEDALPSPVVDRGGGSGRQVVLIGMDGADWAHLRPLALAGRLPNWKRLMDEGLVAPLESQVPTWSPILWTTIATGRTGRDHGILDFTTLELPGLRRGPQRMRVVARLAQRPLDEGPPVPPYVGLAPLVDRLVRNEVLREEPMRATARRVPALWNLLSDRGLTVGILRWWATWPPEEVNGFLVCDERPRKNALDSRRGSTSPTAAGAAGVVTYPPELLGELAALEGPFWEADGDPDPRTTLFDGLDDERFAALPADLVERAWNGWRDDRFGIAAARDLLARRRPDFLAVYTCSIDILGHLLEEWRRTDAAYGLVLERAYEESDRLLGELLAERTPETTYVIVSDHGWSYVSERYGHYHGPAGLFLLAGAGVAADAELERPPSVLDVTPTILALFGLPASDEMPGRVLAEALAHPVPARIPSYGAHRPRWSIEAGAPPSGSDEELQRLRELGYVE